MTHSIPMRDFVDYVLTAGTSRTFAVKRLLSKVEPTDFYEPVREAIIARHRDEKPIADLISVFLDGLSDQRERRIFPRCVSGYQKFLRGKTTEWFEPPMRDYPLGGLSIRVNPELGLTLDGRPYVVKMYFRGDPLSPQRVMVTNQLLAMALATTWPGVTFATLDVRRGRLYPYRPKQEIAYLLVAESQSLVHLLKCL